MEFRRRHNSTFSTLTDVSDGSYVGVLSNEGVDLCRWLGVLDRGLARKVSEARSVLLDIAAWRHDLLGSYVWLDAHVYVVGIRTPEGAAAVMDSRKPMLRTVTSGEDRLGRSAAPKIPQSDKKAWFQKTL